jgi:hypothetical protein
MLFVIEVTKCRDAPVALCIASNVVYINRDRHKKSGPNMIQPNGGPSARLGPLFARPTQSVRKKGLNEVRMFFPLLWEALGGNKSGN